MHTLQTQRLRLRPWQPCNYAPFAQLNANPQVMRYFPSTLDTAASNALADKLQAAIAQRGWGFWAVEVKATQAFIGMLGLNIPTAALPFQPCVEIGWRLAPHAWGYGYATEAAQAALAFGFNTLQLEEIVSFTALPNLPSQAVMQRLGMQRQAQTFAHPALPAGHALSEHCLYRLNQKHWRQTPYRSTLPITEPNKCR